MALDAIDPLPDRRPDFYLAQIALMLASRWRDPKSPSYKLEDFLLFQERSLPSPDEVDDRLRQAFGGMVKKKAP